MLAPTVGMLTHRFHLFLGERTFLKEDAVGHGDLAHVVQRRRPPDVLDLVGGKLESARERGGLATDALCMLARGIVAVLGGQRQALQDIETGFLELRRTSRYAVLQAFGVSLQLELQETGVQQGLPPGGGPPPG